MIMETLKILSNVPQPSIVCLRISPVEVPENVPEVRPDESSIPTITIVLYSHMLLVDIVCKARWHIVFSSDDEAFAIPRDG